MPGHFSQLPLLLHPPAFCSTARNSAAWEDVRICFRNRATLARLSFKPNSSRINQETRRTRSGAGAMSSEDHLVKAPHPWTADLLRPAGGFDFCPSHRPTRYRVSQLQMQLRSSRCRPLAHDMDTKRAHAVCTRTQEHSDDTGEPGSVFLRPPSEPILPSRLAPPKVKAAELRQTTRSAFECATRSSSGREC